MKKYFPDNENNFHVTTFREAMEAIEEGAADFAVLPIENSSAGAVNEGIKMVAAAQRVNGLLLRQFFLHRSKSWGFLPSHFFRSC